MRFPATSIYPATIAGEALSNAAWFCLNPGELLQSAPKRNDNVTLDGVDGVLGREGFDDAQTVDLQFELVGHVEPDGTPYSDPEAGLAANKKLIVASYYRATVDQFGCVEAVIEDRDGVEFSGPVQVDRPVWGTGDVDCSFTMSVTIVDGELTEVGS